MPYKDRQFRPWKLVAFSLGCLAAASCSAGNDAMAPESAVVVAARADSVAQAERAHVGELRVAAKEVLASLLRDSASAVFDSIFVAQPPEADGKVPPMVVCGTINGSPGIEGRRTPTAFIYQSKWTVFVEAADNRVAFAKLWGETCGNAGSVVVEEGEG